MDIDGGIVWKAIAIKAATAAGAVNGVGLAVVSVVVVTKVAVSLMD